MNSVFEYRSYKSFLREFLGGAKKRTGLRAAAARTIGCQTAYLSQVLHGSANLSLEQAFAMNEFLGHDSDESECFLLLVQKERAGTTELREYFQAKISDLTERRLTIKNRVRAQEGLSPADQTVFYSHWYFSAIHVLLSIPEMQTKTALATHLRLPLKTISEALDFLESRQLAILEKDRYRIGPRHMHVSKDSPHVLKHHMNWRLRAMNSLDEPKGNDMHYSVAVSLSREDVIRLKSRMLRLIDENLELVSSSKEEVAYGYTIDLFEI